MLNGVLLNVVTLNDVLLSVVTLNDIMLNDVLLSVVMLNDVLVSVVAPEREMLSSLQVATRERGFRFEMKPTRREICQLMNEKKDYFSPYPPPPIPRERICFAFPLKPRVGVHEIS